MFAKRWDMLSVRAKRRLADERLPGQSPQARTPLRMPIALGRSVPEEAGCGSGSAKANERPQRLASVDGHDVSEFRWRVAFHPRPCLAAGACDP
jgi:hypothetical protein